MEVLVLIVAVAAIVGFRMWQGSGALDDLTSQPDDEIPLPDPRRRPARTDEGSGFAAIRRADPRFDLDEFYARVSEMFVAFHEAHARRDLRAARRFIDERFYPELVERMDSGQGSPPRGKLIVDRARAMTARHEAGMDQVRVLITAHEGSAESPHVQEYWTLVRRQGALTKADLSLYKCPNCGAPTDGDDPTRCAYCGARLADPALDWVVSRIDAD